MWCWLVYQSPDKKLSTKVSGEYFSFLSKTASCICKREHIFRLHRLKKEKEGEKIFKCGFSSLIFARYLQTSLKCSEKIYLQLLLDFSSLQKNSQPLNLHFAVAEIFTLKSITLCVWHILEHRKSIYLGVMRNSGVNLAKELLQSPPLLILSALYTCKTSPRPKAHTKKKTTKKPCNNLVKKIPLILHVI